MSQWTHIAAVIRFDAMRQLKGTIKSNYTQLPDLGKTVTYNDEPEDWDKCTVPCGSEGSLQYQVYEDPSIESLAVYVVMFWGDLRDYDDDKEILDYFKRITQDAMVRQGALTIDVEGRPVINYTFADDGWIELGEKQV